MAPPHLSKRLVGVSLKMYFDVMQSTEYAKAIARSNIRQGPNTTVFVIPSFPVLSLVGPILPPQILLGAQNCHCEDRGAYTGEVSPLMLSQLACKIVELGHAERRRAPFNETDELVGEKTIAVVKNKMIPLICIGESERSNIASEAVGIAVKQCIPQVTTPLENLISEGNGQVADADVVFAYEPVWAIGTSEPAGADHVLDVVTALRKIVKEQLTYRGEVRFLYGGSAGPGTWEKLKSGCDGLFLGRFAHDVGNFVKVIEEVAVG